MINWQELEELAQVKQSEASDVRYGSRFLIDEGEDEVELESRTLRRRIADAFAVLSAKLDPEAVEAVASRSAA
jgi:hypothetical protein